jgi:hypothetical protein
VEVSPDREDEAQVTRICRDLDPQGRVSVHEVNVPHRLAEGENQTAAPGDDGALQRCNDRSIYGSCGSLDLAVGRRGEARVNDKSLKASRCFEGIRFEPGSVLWELMPCTICGSVNVQDEVE